MAKRNRSIPLPWVLLVPYFIALLVFWFIPLIQGFRLSLQSDVLYGEPEPVGFANFIALFHDDRYWHALGNTAYYSALSIPLVIIVGLLLAHILQSLPRQLKGTLSFVLMLPGLTPPIVLGLMYILVFNGPHGLLNDLLIRPFGLPPVDWLRDPRFIKISLVLQTLWRWSGFIALLYSAALAGIPKPLMDLARAEGAEGFTLFRKVVWPLLGNVTVFVAAFLFLDAFVLFEGAYVLLGGSGGTMDAGLLLVAYAYQKAFSLGAFGSSAAIAFSIAPMVAFLLASLLLLQRLRSRWEKPYHNNLINAEDDKVLPVHLIQSKVIHG